MTSYQTHYAGQPGWNDCSIFDGTTLKRTQKRETSPVRYIGAYTTQPPSSSSTSIRSSSTSLSTSPNTNTSTTESSLDSSIDSLQISIDAVKEKLKQLLGFESKLVTREFGHYETRLTKLIPELEEIHLRLIDKAVNVVLESKDLTEAKNLLVQHSLLQTGTSNWVLPLRRVIESIVFIDQ